MCNDITHCCGQGCPLQNTCLRYTQQVFSRYDVFTHLPYDFIAKHCNYYWDERPHEDRTKQRAYQLWQQQGCPENRDKAFWFAAKQQLIEQLRLGR
jgi:hypothetical protein